MEKKKMGKKIKWQTQIKMAAENDQQTDFFFFKRQRKYCKLKAEKDIKKLKQGKRSNSTKRKKKRKHLHKINGSYRKFSYCPLSNGQHPI